MRKRNDWNGIFITIEGADGSGKSTVASLLKRYYDEHFTGVLLTREPGGISIAEKIRAVILNPDHTDMDAKTEVLLYAAARRQHLVEKVIPALKEGKLVICDRFVDSSLSYQGVARGLGIEEVWKINEFAIDDCMPDCTLLFEVDYKIGLRRIYQNQTREVNRLDLEEEKFHQKVSEGYQMIKSQFPERIQCINANQSIEVITMDCIKIINQYIKKFGRAGELHEN